MSLHSILYLLSITRYNFALRITSNQSSIDFRSDNHESSMRSLLLQKVKVASEALTAAVSEESGVWGLGNPIVRAVTGYMPPRAEYFNQFKSFLLSLALIRSDQAGYIKTDMVIYCEEVSIKDLKELGCVEEERRDFSEPEQCIIRIRQNSTDWGMSADPLDRYPVVKSIDILLDFPTSQNYDYPVVLRSDLDVFLTPGFANWLPTDEIKIYTGQGGYGSENAFKHLQYVSTKALGLNFSGLKDIGSTWYGVTKVLVAAASLTVATMRWMITQEFTEYEICCSGTDGWPYWHYGVLLLYGGHIAVNAIQAKHV